jgi:hypothetical protein
MTGLRGHRETRGGGAEIKFLVAGSTADAIRHWARPRTAPDPHGTGPAGDQYRTTTIYFDTDAFDVYWRRGSYGRSKLRIRRYGDADHAFVERKLRTSTMVVKRRTIVRVAALSRLDDPHGDQSAARWFHDRLRMRRLAAVCQVGYVRTARVLRTQYGDARLTLDTDLRAQTIRHPVYQPGHGTPVDGAQTIVELKFAVAMPALFKLLVEEFRLEPMRVSKYRLAMDAIAPAIARAAEPAGARLPCALEGGHA